MFYARLFVANEQRPGQLSAQSMACLCLNTVAVRVMLYGMCCVNRLMVPVCLLLRLR